MRNIFKKFLFTILFSSLVVVAGFLVADPVFAAVRCEVQYGGQEVCVRTGQLQIDKEVFDPQNKKFVDNLGINDYRFSPGEEVTFKLKIKNVGDATFDLVNVMDTIPNMFESPGGLSFQLKDLKAGEEREKDIKAKVVASDKFPVDKSVLCVVNVGEAVSGDNKDRDTAQVCLERKVLGKGVPQVLPPTGPENWLVILGGSLLSLITGVYLLKLSKIY